MIGPRLRAVPGGLLVTDAEVIEELVRLASRESQIRRARGGSDLSWLAELRAEAPRAQLPQAAIRVDRKPVPRRRLLNTEQAAKELGIAVRTVRWRLKHGELTGQKVGGSWLVQMDGEPA